MGWKAFEKRQRVLQPDQEKEGRLTAPRSAMKKCGQILPVDGRHFQMRHDGD
jgi:hypothetical protein